MKIGIITFHAALNVGAVLQAYALETHLTKLGYDVEFIDYSQNRKINWKSFIAKGILKTFNKWQDYFYGKYYAKRNRFNHILKIGKSKYNTLAELQNNPPKYDIYIAGSDQVWNIGSNKFINEVYFLNFGANSVKRIAYAASLGQGDVPKLLEESLKENIIRFDFVSIREKNGLDYIKGLVGNNKEIYHINDPTLLLYRDEYLKLIDIREEPNNFLVSYVLWQFEPIQIKALDYIKTKLGLEHINLRNPDTCIRFSKARNIIVTPTQWLNWIYNADFVVCCSFHVVVFALVFHKQFVVITPRQNARIQSLLAPINMENRIILSFDKENIDSIISKKIDWASVDDYLKKEKQKGISFLNQSLN
jgi:hypothetical protein